MSGRQGTETGGAVLEWPHVSVLGFRLDVVGLDQAARWAVDAAAAEGYDRASGRTRIAVSFNPELVMRARRDEAAASALAAADLCYPDGVGAVWAARRKKSRRGGAEGDARGRLVVERVAGIELAHRVLESAARLGLSVFFLGAAPGVAEEAARRVGLELPGLRVAGCRDGYLSSEAEQGVVAAIRESGARILLVAMGAPRQEVFLWRQRDRLAVPVALGVGGTFDVWSGRVKRAPAWMARIGLEWLYRLGRDPRRIRRQAVLPKYVWAVLRHD